MRLSQKSFAQILKYSLALSTLESFAEGEIYNIPQDEGFIERVNHVFLEYGKVDPSFILDIEGGLEAKAGSQYTITFIGEGAGYKNSFGYYTYDSQGNVDQMTTIFENASGSGRGLAGGGNLNVGDSVDMEPFEADTNFGFWVKANGYRNPRGRVYYSETALNPDNFDHLAIGYDAQAQQAVFGFEDLYGGGDRDYNDVMFSISSKTENGIYSIASQEGMQNSNIGDQLSNMTGNVYLNLGIYAEVSGLNDMQLYRSTLDGPTTDVEFSGSTSFGVKSNFSVIIQLEITNLESGNISLPVSYTLDNIQGVVSTPPGTHKGSHVIRANTIVPDLSQIPSEETVSGKMTVTVLANVL